MPGSSAASRPDIQQPLDDWLDYVSSVHWQNWDLGLDRMHLLVERLGLQRPAPLVFTVAGTNGKGSTCVALEAGLLAQGKQVACTLSPHILRFNERFRINGEEASDDQVIQALTAVDEARGSQSLSYFEFSALAFLWLAKHSNVDAVVLEIGLGGRLDAFNAVDADVAVITSIDFDHEQFLGDTLDKIGAEKAGILRPDQQVVLGPGLPDSVHQRARELALSPSCFAQEFEAWEQGDCHHPGADVMFRFEETQITVARGTGNIAPQNIAVAAQALALSDPNFADSFENSFPEVVQQMCHAHMAARFEVIEFADRKWILDVAHNVAGAEFLLARIARSGFNISQVICGILNDKHHRDFLARVSRQVNAPWALVDTKGERGYAATALLEDAQAIGLTAEAMNSMTHAVAKVVSCTQPQDVILCIGSFNLVEQFHNVAST